MKLLHALLAGLLAVTLPAPARSDPAPATEKTVEVSLIGLGRLPRYATLQNGRQETPVELVAGTRTGVYHYAGQTPLVFFTDKKDAVGKPVRTVLATVAYPADWTRVVVLLSATGATTGEPLRGLAVDDSPEGFPAGQMKLFNFYRTSLAVSNGAAQPVQIPPGQSRLVPLTANAKGRAWIRMAVQRADQWKALPPFVTEIEPGMRALALAYEDDGQPARTVIFDTIPEKPEPAALRLTLAAAQ